MRNMRLAVLGLSGLLAMAATARAQVRPYIGFVYPAGGQQGTTVQVRLGGQGLDDVNQVLVSGPGVSAKVVEYWRRLGPQEMTLLREQLAELKRQGSGQDRAATELIEKIQKRMDAYCQMPACASIANIAFVEVRLDPGAEPGERQIRLATPRGVSNPLPFVVGQLPEVARKPMNTATLPVLGKEELAQRKRPDEEVEVRLTLPCTANGQVASGEVNRYRFEARKGQRLVMAVQARQLIPFMADAVPGWFQPVLTLYDATGKEVAYSDDFRFKPDPVIYYEVPRDGEYVLAIHDAIYRGREDFVYRLTVGEVPFVTSVFPLGARAGSKVSIQIKGWNVEGARILAPPTDAPPGIYAVAARRGRLVSNRVPFALDTLPESFDEEPNNDPAHAQKVHLPLIINGRVDRRGDWDVFAITGRAGEAIVAEVSARRLDSPLDSFLKITDSSGKVLAFNDDHEDLGFAVTTHHADSYVMLKLPADGTYYVHLGDTAQHGGEEYAYRLRLSRPRPDFELFAVPSSLGLRSKSTASVTIHAVRKDGFSGPIRLALKNPPTGFSAAASLLAGAQALGRLAVRTDLVATQQPVRLAVEGRAKVGEQGGEIVREAIPAEDRMQAFLWRHVVPAEELTTLVFNPSYQPPPKRTPGPRPANLPETQPQPTSGSQTAPKPKFTKQQVAFRLRQLKLLYEEGLLTDRFYYAKVAECEAAE